VAPSWLLGVVVCFASCAATVGAIELVSVDQEITIGREANAEVRKRTLTLRDRQVTAYVEALGQRLARAAPGAKYPYSFQVADYRELNAFSLPGGPVWVNRGVLAAAANESQVAAVMAHEIAHIAQRHSAGQLTNAIIARWSLTVLGAMLGNTGGSGAAQAAGALLTNGIFLKFSRDDEREADRVGLQIMTKAGWDPRGMIELLDLVRRQQARDPRAVGVFLSTHPAPEERLTAVRTAVGTRRGGLRDSAAFRSAKAHLRTLPAARSMPAT